jgi:hypothetical protein
MMDFNAFIPPGKAVYWVFHAPGSYYMSNGYGLFDSLEEFSAVTGYAKNSLLDIDYAIFKNPVRPKAGKHVDIPFDADFSLTQNAKVVDKGKLLPNINDDFTGESPDLGFLEYGHPLPHYGPRP